LTAVTYFKADVKFVQVQPFRPFSAQSLSRTDRCVCVCVCVYRVLDTSGFLP